MKRVFADANYFVALLNRRDELHDAAEEAQRRIKGAHLVTTDEVLSEVLTFFCDLGPMARAAAVQIVEALRRNPQVTVTEQSRATFDGGLAFYKSRAEREYSLADCISLELMKLEGITEALTNDHHFEQEGFAALLRSSNA